MEQAIARFDRSVVKPLSRKALETPIALSAWAVLVIAAFAWGRTLMSSGTGIGMNAPPLFGRFDARISIRLLPIAIVAAFAVAYLPRLATKARFGQLLASTMLATLLWAAALSFVDGAGGLLGTLENPTDYLAALPLPDGPLAFLSGFTDDIASFPLHVQSHPPGAVLFLWGLDSVGLSGAWWATLMIVVAGASATIATLLAVREIAGEKSARACAPFVVLGPFVIWIATSVDALFLAISAWGVALFVLATGRRNSTGDVVAGAAGVLLGASLFFSYGVVPLGLIVASVAGARRRVRPLLVAGAGAALVAASFAVLGFWWPEGLGTTIGRYEAGIATHRPYGFSLVNNLAAFAIALGPAIAVALTRLRDRRLWLIVGSALAAIAVANLSGLSKGEVERIWLPFAPWVVVASASLEDSRPWLALQTLAALAVGVLVVTPW